MHMKFDLCVYTNVYNACAMDLIVFYMKTHPLFINYGLGCTYRIMTLLHGILR